MMWWMMYTTTVLDLLDNICYLSMSGFGIEPIIGKCMSDKIEDELIWNDCQINQDCPEWFQCQNEWKIHMLSTSIITVVSFFINCLFVYCLHIAHIQKSYKDIKDSLSQRSIIKPGSDSTSFYDLRSKKIQVV
ncbi:unnamed protein product [Cunninghamella echinulata]